MSTYQLDTEAATLVENVEIVEAPKRSFFRPAMIILSIVALVALGFGVTSSTGFNSVQASLNLKESTDGDELLSRRPTKSPTVTTEFPTFAPNYVSTDDKTWKPTVSPTVIPEEKSFFPTYAPNDATPPPQTYPPTRKPTVADKTRYPTYTSDYKTSSPTVAPSKGPKRSSEKKSSSKKSSSK